jgi:hypothetical protein
MYLMEVHLETPNAIAELTHEIREIDRCFSVRVDWMQLDEISS